MRTEYEDHDYLVCDCDVCKQKRRACGQMPEAPMLPTAGLIFGNPADEPSAPPKQRPLRGRQPKKSRRRT